MKNITLLFLCILLFSTPLLAQEFSEIIKPNLDKLISKGELNSSDLNWVVSREHKSSISNIHHIYFNQTLNGIDIDNTESGLHIDEKGKLISSKISFIKNTISKSKGYKTPLLSVLEALNVVVHELGLSITEPLTILSKKNELKHKIVISKGGISESNINAKLNYFKNAKNELVLVWKINILEIGYGYDWQVIINASTGKVLDKTDLLIHCEYENNSSSINKQSLVNVNNLTDCEECYEVVAMPLESPYYGERSVVINPANIVASPYGWHDVNGIIGSEYTTTKGNNIDAFIGTSGDDGYQPYGGKLLEFTEYPFNQDFTLEERLEDASITNLFYWGNICHDVLYQYGFTEEAGNFQENNYNNGGLEEDSIIALGQIQLDFCNAYFRPTVDGARSFINMNVCGDKDGAFDNMVIVHEYIHGLTIRSFGYGCTKKEVPFEGWSDWYGLMFTMSQEDLGTNPRGFATYLLDQGVEGSGGRIYPYSTDMDINPQTYNSIKNYDAIHNIGSVWATILWELTWALIGEYGYDPDIYNFTGDINQDAGNIIALAIVTEGIKLGHCSSGFVDARDDILSAFNSIYKGENNCFLWDAFAKRGLGVYAYEGISESTTDGIESFDVPPSIAEFNFELANICINSSVNTNLGGGLPSGGIYSGNGVIDDGNGQTFSFDPAIAGAGLHSVVYEIIDSPCTEASLAGGTIEVIEDILAPEIDCTEELTVSIPYYEDQYTVILFSYLAYYSDNCDSNVSITQSPITGSQLDIGKHIVEFEVTDSSGNQSQCSFNLIVEQETEEIDEKFDVYPNPTKNDITLTSTVNIELLETSVYDINGRLVLNHQFNDFGFEKTLSFNDLATGIYFLKIDTADFSVVKKVIKE